MFKDKEKHKEKQAKSLRTEKLLYDFLRPLLQLLNQQIDRRLVRTFMGLVMALLRHRHRNNGLLLSELGGHLPGPERCRAGTKRISKLLHSEKWRSKLLSSFLWKRQRMLALPF